MSPGAKNISTPEYKHARLRVGWPLTTSRQHLMNINIRAEVCNFLDFLFFLLPTSFTFLGHLHTNNHLFDLFFGRISGLFGDFFETPCPSSLGPIKTTWDHLIDIPKDYRTEVLEVLADSVGGDPPDQLCQNEPPSHLPIGRTLKLSCKIAFALRYGYGRHPMQAPEMHGSRLHGLQLCSHPLDDP